MRPSRTPARLSPLQPGRIARRRRSPLIAPALVGMAALVVALLLALH
jgi:hypothetical protein